MINIITVEREYGCGGGVIAQNLATHLGWKLWDRELTVEIASRLKCDVGAVRQREERPDPALYRLMKAFMRGSYEDRVSGGNMELLDAENLAVLFEKVINDAADSGNCVIVGRGSPWFLRTRKTAFHVFIYAPFAEKLRRLKTSGKTVKEAEDLIERVDAERASFIKKFYGSTWPRRDLYHLMINSSVGNKAVEELIVREVDILNSAGSAISRKTG